MTSGKTIRLTCHTPIIVFELQSNVLHFYRDEGVAPRITSTKLRTGLCDKMFRCEAAQFTCLSLPFLSENNTPRLLNWPWERDKMHLAVCRSPELVWRMIRNANGESAVGNGPNRIRSQTPIWLAQPMNIRYTSRQSWWNDWTHELYWDSWMGTRHIAAVPIIAFRAEVLWMFFGPVLLEDGRRRGPTELSCCCSFATSGWMIVQAFPRKLDRKSMEKYIVAPRKSFSFLYMTLLSDTI